MFECILFVSVLGSLLCLDRVFVQAMISRPVVVAPLVGLLLHHFYAGLVIGAILELIWIDRLPIGTYIPPNDSLTAVLATAAAALSAPKGGGVPPELISLSVLAAVPFGLAAKRMDTLIIRANNVLSDQALEAVRRNDVRSVERKSYRGLLRVFLAYALFLLAAQCVMIPAVRWGFSGLNAPVLKALLWMYYFLPFLGIAVAVNMLKLRRAVAVFCTVFLAVAVLLEIFHVL
ncbi:MAG TPA: PTS sugar transporter subunit IIC [Smithella sp.]|nr:PTS sugar transporter subunit IIC [Smithella sp.]